MTTPGPLKADVMQLPGSGQVNNAWNGVPGSGDTVLFANNDIVNTWYLGFRNTITVGAPNTIPVPPSGTVTLQANRTVYAVAASGTTPLVIIPGGGAYFQGLTQGQGKLVLPSIQSPNFITQVSGWTINKDGSAEFNNLTIRGTFFGVNFVLNQNGMFFYDPTEVLGNLVISIAPKLTTGPLGETVQPGIVLGKSSDVQLQLLRDPVFATGIVRFLMNNATYTNPGILAAVISGPPTFAAMNVQGPATTVTGFKDSMREQFNSSDASSSFANVTYTYTDTNGVTHLVEFMDGSGTSIAICSRLTATNPTTGTGPGNVAQSETWHDCRPLLNSFIGTIANRYPLQYRKCADGDIEVTGFIQFPGSGGPNFNSITFANLAAGWRPLSNTGHRLNIWFETNVTPVGSPNVQVDTSGNLQMHNGPTTAGLAGTIAEVSGRFPLDNTGLILS